MSFIQILKQATLVDVVQLSVDPHGNFAVFTLCDGEFLLHSAMLCIQIRLHSGTTFFRPSVQMDWIGCPSFVISQYRIYQKLCFKENCNRYNCGACVVV